MAKLGKTLAEVSIIINGKKQAQQVLKAMETSADELRAKITTVKSELETLAQSGGGPQYDAKHKELVNLQKQLQPLERQINEMKKLNVDVEDMLKRVSELSIKQLNDLQRRLKAIQSQLDPKNANYAQFSEFLINNITKVTDLIKNRKGELTEFRNIMNNIAGASPKQLDDVEKRLLSLMKTVTEGSHQWRIYNNQLKVVREAKLTGPMEYMQEQMAKAAKLSADARAELKKYWTEVKNGSKDGSKNFKEAVKQLEELDRIETDLATKQAKKVMAKPENFSAGEIKEAIKITEQLQSNAKTKKEWHDYALQIAAAKKELDKFSDTSRMKVMSEQFKDLKKLSEQAYAEQKKYWQEVKRTHTESSDEYKKASANLEKMQKLEDDRLKKDANAIIRQANGKKGFQGTIEQNEKAIKTLQEWRKHLDAIGDVKSIQKLDAAMEHLNKNLGEAERKTAKDMLSTNLNTAGTGDIQRSIDLLTKYQGTLDPVSKEWEDINKLITDGKERIKQLTDDNKMKVMSEQFKDYKDLSVNAFAEQKKYWTEVKNTYAENTNQYKTAIANLEKINELEKERTKTAATEKMGAIGTGGFKGTLEEGKAAIELLKKYQQQLDATNTDELQRVETVIKRINTDMDEFVTKNARKTLTDDLGTAGTADIKQAVEWLTKYQGTLEPLSDDWKEINKEIEAGNERIKEVTGTARYDAMKTQFADIKNLSEQAFDEQKKYWEEVKRTYAEGTEQYDTAIASLKEIKELEQSRTAAEADKTMTGIEAGGFKGTIEEGKAAIELLKKYQQQLDATNTDELQRVEDVIRRINTDMDEFVKKNARKTLTSDLKTAGTDDIKQAVDWLTKYQGTLEPLSKEWREVNKEITDGNERLKELADKTKLEVMSKQFKDLKVLSANAFNEQRKYWEGIRDSVAQTDPLYDRAIKKLEQMADLENSRKKADATTTLTTNLNTAGTGEIKQAVDWLTKYQSTLEPLEQEWKDVNALIEDGNKRLKEVSDTTKFNAMSKQFANFGNLSKSALAEQKKYWEGLADSMDKTDKRYQTVLDNVKKIKDAEKAQLSADATAYITEANSGNWDKTIGETEEAIKLIQEYKKQLNAKTDAALIQDANRAIETLNGNVTKTKEGLMEISQAKLVAQGVKGGWFDGTAEEINKAKKALEEYRKTLKLKGAADEVKKVDEMIANLARSTELGGKNLKNLNAVLSNLDRASVEELQTAAKQLQQQLQGATRGVKNYAETAAQLRNVNRELERARKEWEGQESLFVRMTKRLSVYMAAYGSLSFIVDKVKELGQANLKLSDSIADVAKTTGLEAKELAKLGSEIRAIDTRTTQEQLYELAAAAGQLGIKSENEIAGFVRAANMITVSLNELGTEATTQLMKIATLTGESQGGTEKALLSIGSAINELTASSAAAAGPIVDLMNRMGGIAAQSGITSAQMAAIGATADALGQSVEITGTSMNKFLSTLMSSSDQIAYALNMDAKALRSLLNEGRTMDAVIAVFEKMNQMGGLGKLAPVMGELGSEGARMTQVLAAMAEKVDFLKGQLDISTDAYEKAISIQNEYNVKNENAIAILQRMGNAIKEVFVNNVVVDGITTVLRAVYQFFSYLKDGSLGAYTLTAAIAGMTAALLANRIAWVQNIQAMTAAHPLLMRRVIWSALTTAVHTLTAALKTGTLAIKSFGLSLLQANTWTNLWSKSLKGLKTFLAGNWITLAVGAVAAFGAAIYKAATYVSETAKATAKYNRELQEEIDKVDTLFNSLTRLNSKEADRAKTINTINQQYSKYLGFMLDEKDSAEKLAAAHQLINAELRKRMALNLQNTLTSKAQNDYFTEFEKTIADIGTKVKNTRVRITKKDGTTEDRELYTSDVMNTVSEMINDRVYESVKVTQEEVNGQIVHRQQMGSVDLDKLKADIRAALEKEFENVQTYDANGNIIKGDKTFTGQLVFGNIESYIESMLEERIKYQNSIINAENQANIELRSATKAVLKQRENINAELTTEIENAQNDSEKLEANLQAADKALKSAKAAAEKYAKDDKSKGAETARENLTKAQQNYAKEERILKDHYKKIADNAYDYIDNQKEILKEHYSNIDDIKDENLKKQKIKERDEINAQIDEYTNIAKEAAKKVPGFDPWGKGRDVKDWKEFADIVTNIDTSSAEALAAAYKSITEDTARIPSDVQSFYNMFEGTGLQDKLKLDNPDDVAKQIHKWAEQIKEKLATKYGRNTSLGFIFESEGSGGKKTAKQMYDGWLAALEAYYNERATLIRQNGMKEKKLETEINRELEALNAEKLANQRELEEGLLNDMYKNSTFDPTKFKGVITGTEYFANLTLEQMRGIVSAGGPKLDAEIRKNMTERMVKLEEQAYKIKQRIDKILLEDDLTEKVAKEYLDALDQLGLLFNIYTESETDRTEEEGERRLAYMREWSQDAYMIDSEGLKKRMSETAVFNEWMKNRNDEDFEALLVQLRKFHDDQEEADRRSAERRKRIADNIWKNAKDPISGKTREETTTEKVVGEEEDLDMYETARDLGLASERRVEDAQIAVLQAKIDKEQEYMNFLVARMDMEILAADQERQRAANTLANLEQAGLATQEYYDALKIANQEYDMLVSQRDHLTRESLEKISGYQQQIQDVEMATTQRKLETLKGYTDAVVTFGEQMGEAAYGEVEDRKEAGRQLLKTTLQLTKDLIMAEVQRLVMKKALGQKEVVQEQTKDATITGNKVSHEINNLTVETAATGGKVALGEAGGAAKIIGELGWWGIPLIAVISAALSALMGAAMSAVSKSKSEIESVGGRKLSTGMLTYAEGNYPVLGNDGKVYDAKYEGSNIKTGVYGGGAHFGIFSEKQPEMIVDGKTTQKLILNYPYIYDAITTIAKNGRLVNAMPTFASGDYPAGMRQIAQVEAVDVSAGVSPDMERMSAALEQSNAVIAKLNQILVSGQINANVDPYANSKATKRAERFMKRRGID